MIEEEFTDEDLKDLARAEVHVHFHDGEPEIGIQSGRIFFAVECSRNETEVLLLALRSDVDYVSVACGEAQVEISTEIEIDGAPSPVVILAISHREDDRRYKAMLSKNRLILLLTRGCVNSVAPEKCADAN